MGRRCARTAQLDDSLAAWRGCASPRARQASRSWPATEGQPQKIMAAVWPSKRAARVHAPETCAPILDSRHTPSRKSLQRLHWRSRSYGDGDGDGNDSAALKAEQVRGCSWKSLLRRRTPHLYKFGIMYKIIRQRDHQLLIRHYVSVINSLGILCTSHFCPDKSGRQVSLYSVSSNLGAIFELNRSSMPRPRILGTGRLSR